MSIFALGRLNEINADSKLDFNQMTITFFKIIRNIPDCLRIVFHTPEGNVVHTGDFKFDLMPANDEVSAIHKMAEIGAKADDFADYY